LAITNPPCIAISAIAELLVLLVTLVSHTYLSALEFRDEGLIIKRYVNSSVYFTLLYMYFEIRTEHRMSKSDDGSVRAVSAAAD